MKKVLNSFHLKLITVLLLIVGRSLVQYFLPAMELAAAEERMPAVAVGMPFQIGYALYCAAVPIAGFLMVEGLMRGRDAKQLFTRIAFAAFLSELLIDGVNYMTGLMHYPAFRLNLYFTMLLAAAAILFVELKLKKYQEQTVKYNMLCLVVYVLAAMLAMLSGADQGQTGILIIIAIYIFRNNLPMMLVSVGVLQILLGAGSIVAYAPLISVLVLWLYNGEQGLHNKTTRMLFYAAYPVAYAVLMLVLKYVL